LTLIVVGRKLGKLLVLSMAAIDSSEVLLLPLLIALRVEPVITIFVLVCRGANNDIQIVLLINVLEIIVIVNEPSRLSLSGKRSDLSRCHWFRDNLPPLLFFVLIRVIEGCLVRDVMVLRLLLLRGLVLLLLLLLLLVLRLGLGLGLRLRLVAPPFSSIAEPFTPVLATLTSVRFFSLLLRLLLNLVGRDFDSRNRES